MGGNQTGNDENDRPGGHPNTHLEQKGTDRPRWRPETRAVHTGVYKDSSYNSVTTPIYPSSTFYFDRVGVNKGYDYTRSANPTRKAAQENIADLEGGTDGWLTSSGMSAITSVLHIFKNGDHIVTGHDIYGGTYRLFKAIASEMGIEVSFVNMGDEAAVRSAIRPNTKALFIETPSNPLLNIVDIALMTSIAREHSLLSISDNTFLTPLLQSPFELGCDIIVHSTTKYLNGHSDIIGGAIVVKDSPLAERLDFLVNALGTACSPFDAWLLLRGLKTLPCRMAAHEENAGKIAARLDSHPAIERVYYPGLPNHPGHELAKSQQRGFGGMVSFDLKDGTVTPDQFFAALKLVTLAESLGGVESLVEQPYTMSHASMNEEARREAGITPNLIRLSTGIEHADDIIEDIEQALTSPGGNE
jgi:O-succinylhomoserine (thiol)-lyase